jgi:hypothetical protein
LVFEIAAMPQSTNGPERGKWAEFAGRGRLMRAK